MAGKGRSMEQVIMF